MSDGVNAMMPVTSTHYVNFIQISDADDWFSGSVQHINELLYYLTKIKY